MPSGYKHLKPEQKLEVWGLLVEACLKGEPPTGIAKAVAAQCGTTRARIFKIWKTGKTQRLSGVPVTVETFARKTGSGRPLKWDREEIKNEVMNLPWNKRGAVLKVAGALGIPKTTALRLKKEGVIHRHRSFYKPKLTDNHRIARIDHCLGMRDPNDPSKFQDMMNKVHVDEKWFYEDEEGRIIVLAEGEEPPVRTTRHKKHITKVQFLCAQARPRVVNGVMWDGKIGIWPVGRIEPARRRSANRPRGTPVWKNEKIDRNKYRELLIDEVLPAILAKFPTTYLMRGVEIQQDGAKAHILPNDEEWMDAVNATGCNITVYTQPAQSPDTNINDLAFFYSIQNLKNEEEHKNALELIKAVKKAYDEYSPKKINRMWLTHQACMNETLKCNGGNEYKLPHMNKDKLEREGRLPTVLNVDACAATFDPTYVPPQPMQTRIRTSNEEDSDNDVDASTN